MWWLAERNFSPESINVSELSPRNQLDVARPSFVGGVWGRDCSWHDWTQANSVCRCNRAPPMCVCWRVCSHICGSVDTSFNWPDSEMASLWFKEKPDVSEFTSISWKCGALDPRVNEHWLKISIMVLECECYWLGNETVAGLGMRVLLVWEQDCCWFGNETVTGLGTRLLLVWEWDCYCFENQSM